MTGAVVVNAAAGHHAAELWNEYPTDGWPHASPGTGRLPDPTVTITVGGTTVTTTAKPAVTAVFTVDRPGPHAAEWTSDGRPRRTTNQMESGTSAAASGRHQHQRRRARLVRAGGSSGGSTKAHRRPAPPGLRVCARRRFWLSRAPTRGSSIPAALADDDVPLLRLVAAQALS